MMSTEQSAYGATDNAAIAAQFINNTNRNIFLTGKAGTGKTTFLKNLSQLTFKNMAVVAPTGIAAINAGGTTIHSFFQIPPQTFIPTFERPDTMLAEGRFQTAHTLLRQQRMSADKQKTIRALELLVIDEVSMLRADLLDAIDTVLKSVRRAHNRPFGGIQVLFIGDMLQLPPVIKDDEWDAIRKYYKTGFFFDARALVDTPPLYIELEKIYRQSDPVFISLLNNLRNNTVSKRDEELLNQYYKPGFYAVPQDKYIQLTTHNHKADTINTDALRKLKSKTEKFKATIKDDFPEKMFPTDETIELKIGAQLMFLVNDPDKRYFNGKIGKLTGISDDRESIEVFFEDSGETYSIEKYTWENITYSVNGQNSVFPKVLGKFTQFPVKLAWAITVHKSQGLTFQKAIIDIEQAFAPGQVYVALSRLTSLSGLVLSSKVNFRSLHMDQTISNFAETKASDIKLRHVLDSESKQYIQDYIASRFDLTPLQDAMIRYVEESDGEKDGKSVRSKYRTWARTLVNEMQPAHDTALRFVAQVKRLGDDWTAMQIRVDAAKKYFVPQIQDIISSINKHAEEVRAKHKKVTGYMKQLEELRADVQYQLQQYDKAEVFLRSVIANTPVNRADLYAAEEYPRLTKEEDEDETKTLRTRSRTGPHGGLAKSRVAKGDSAKLTLAMHQRGMSVDEIATDRGLSKGTIMSHFVEAIGLGLAKAEDFIQYERLENIRIAAKELGTKQLIPLKEHLGESYSFDELRMALTGKKEVAPD